jgi:hypothetical protein
MNLLVNLSRPRITRCSVSGARMIVEKRRFLIGMPMWAVLTAMQRRRLLQRNALQYRRKGSNPSQMEMYDAPEQFGVYGCISGYR